MTRNDPVGEGNILPLLVGLETYVRDPLRTQDFWQEHFQLLPDAGTPLTYRQGEIIWRLLPGGRPCHTPGPHGVLPAFDIDDFGAARAYLQKHNIPIVFEEMLPGLNLLIFLDPDATPIALHEITSPGDWDLSARRSLRTRQRRDEVPATSLRLGPLVELTVYAHDVTASGHFYRTDLGLPLGMAFFGHTHLLAGQFPLVIRPTSWRCHTPNQRHATEPVFAVEDIATLARRLERGGHVTQEGGDGRLHTFDPAGWPIHFIPG